MVAWWLTVGNELGFAPISISMWWRDGRRLETAWAWVDGVIWLFWMTFDFDFGVVNFGCWVCCLQLGGVVVSW